MRIWPILILALVLAGCGKGGYTPPTPPVPPAPTPIDVGASMFATVEYMAGNTHVQDHTLRSPHIPEEYNAFTVLYVRVTFATGGITELRSIFGKKCAECQIEVIAEEKWDHPPKMMIEVQSYFVEPGSGIGVPYFPSSLAVGEEALFAGTAKWSWGLSHEEPLASGQFNYTLALNARIDRKLGLYETYDFPKFQRNYVFGAAGMESLTDVSPPPVAGVLYIPNDPSCVEDTPCEPFPGFWVELDKVKDVDESRCISVLRKTEGPGPRGIIEYPIPLMLCRVNRAVWKADGTIMALKP